MNGKAPMFRLSRNQVWTLAAGLLICSLAALGILAELRIAAREAPRVVEARANAPKACTFYFRKEDLCASLLWLKRPEKKELMTLADKGEFSLQFWKKGTDQPAPPPGRVVVSLWMPGMGHGSEAPKVVADAGQVGRYHVDDVLFSMGGEWEIWVSLLASNALLDKSKLAFNLE